MAISAVALGVGVSPAQGPAPLPTTVTQPSDASQWKAWPDKTAVAPTPAPLPEKTITFRKPADMPAVVPVSMVPQSPVGAASEPQDTKPTLPPPAATMGPAPKKEEIFRLDSDKVLNERIKRDSGKKDFEVPKLPQLTPAGTPYTAKTANYPAMGIALEPGYVVHRKLLFEEKNSERYGWEFGAAQPAISAMYFYRDCLSLPYKLASNITERYDTNAGKCLPGTPVPYFLYPPELSITGLAFEGVIITGASWILP